MKQLLALIVLLVLPIGLIAQTVSPPPGGSPPACTIFALPVVCADRCNWETRPEYSNGIPAGCFFGCYTGSDLMGGFSCVATNDDPDSIRRAHDECSSYLSSIGGSPASLPDPCPDPPPPPGDHQDGPLYPCDDPREPRGSEDPN